MPQEITPTIGRIPEMACDSRVADRAAPYEERAGLGKFDLTTQLANALVALDTKH